MGQVRTADTERSLSRRERVGVRGYSFSIVHNPSPGSRFALAPRSPPSPYGRGKHTAPPYKTSRCLLRRTQAQQMADRVDQIGAVHGVEVEIGDAAFDQVEHLLGGDGSRDQL